MNRWIHSNVLAIGLYSILTDVVISASLNKNTLQTYPLSGSRTGGVLKNRIYKKEFISKLNLQIKKGTYLNGCSASQGVKISIQFLCRKTPLGILRNKVAELHLYSVCRKIVNHTCFHFENIVKFARIFGTVQIYLN